MKVRKKPTPDNTGVGNIKINKDLMLNVTRDESIASVTKKFNDLTKNSNTPGVYIECNETTPKGVPIVPEFKHVEALAAVDKSSPQIDIIVPDEKMGELLNRYESEIFENEKELYMKSPYDDMLITCNNRRFRIILYKQGTQVFTSKLFKHKREMDHVGYIIMEPMDGSDRYISFGGLFYRLLGSPNAFKLTVDPKFLTIYEHNPAERKRFRDKLAVDKYTQLQDATDMIMFLTLLPAIMRALMDPEVKEIWETKEINLSNDPHSTGLVSNKKPLENIKRVYMCEHQHTDREIERHTNKWYVRGHEVHRKDGKVFFRKGHYKGPGRDDKDNKPEPRKMVLNKFGNSLDKEDLDNFYNLLK
jgi:hypothetical protein